MPLVPLRAQIGKNSPNDLLVEVQDTSIEYLRRLTLTKNARVSAYLDRDWPQVEANYGELVIEGSQNDNLVVSVLPGSRTRTGIQLPGPMKKGEQLTLQIELKSKAGS
jgi:hypothetical protein